MASEDLQHGRFHYYQEELPPLTKGIDRAVLEARYRRELMRQEADPTRIEERRLRLTAEEADEVEALVKKMINEREEQ